MYIFEWDESILTGYEAIDKQHRELYEKVGAFFSATTRNEEKGKIDEMMRYLNGFFVTHFTDEEQIHKDGGYPHFDEHVKAHEQILKDLNEIDSLYYENGYTEALELKLYNLLIKDMFSQMKQFDIPLARYIKERNLKTRKL